MKDLLKPFSFSLHHSRRRERCTQVGKDLQLWSVCVHVYVCVELMLPILLSSLLLLLSSSAKRASLLISLVSMSDCWTNCVRAIQAVGEGFILSLY